ncbi:hypothetical protein QQ045_001976 [Rhodiola kirilowii]
MGREVSESCVDSLLKELVSSTPKSQTSPPDGSKLSATKSANSSPKGRFSNLSKLVPKAAYAYAVVAVTTTYGNRGTFVLQDSRFRWLTRMSAEPTPESTDPTDDPESKASEATSMHLYFPC